MPKQESEYTRKLKAMTPEQLAEFRRKDREAQKKWRERKRAGQVAPRANAITTDSDGWEWFDEEQPISKFPAGTRVLFVNEISGKRIAWEIVSHWSNKGGTNVRPMTGEKQSFVAHTDDGDKTVEFTSRSTSIPISCETPIAAVRRA